MSLAVIFPAATVCILGICLWVYKVYGRTHALIAGAIAMGTLTYAALAEGVFSLDVWLQNDPLRIAVMFVPQALTALVLFRWARADAEPAAPEAEERSTLRLPWLWLCFWLTPVLVLFLSRLRVVGESGTLGRLIWWSTASIALYLVVPLTYSRISGQSWRSWGLSLSRFRTEARTMLLIVPTIAGVVWVASADAAFVEKYPFLHVRESWWELGVFEVFYGLTFVALEFYFRGFMVHAGAKVIGAHSVPLMASFYCLFHVGKPLPEIAASLVGGLLLGYLSLRLKSIAVGVAAHLTLAWGVDTAVLLRNL